VGVLRILTGGHLIRPAEQLVAVVLRHTEQACNGLQRQLARHLFYEVTGLLRGGRLGDLLGANPQLLLQPPDRARSEATGDDLSQSGVLRGIHVEQHAALQVDGVARHLLRPHGDCAVRRAAEDVVALRHLLDVGVLGDQPVAFVSEPTRATGNVNPVDRLGLTQLGKLGDGQTREIELGIEEVEVR
jgi:hypothetical protein